jgi:hypothetical protein
MNCAEFGLFILLNMSGVKRLRKKVKNYFHNGKIVRNFQKIQAYEFCFRKDEQAVIQDKRKCQ